MVFFKYLVVYSRLVVESVAESDCVKIRYVFITFFVFAQKHKVVKRLLAVMIVKVFGKVKFRADYRLYSYFVAGVEKRDRAVHVSVVGYRESGHTERFRAFGNGRNSRRSVENTVFGMNV